MKILKYSILIILLTFSASFLQATNKIDVYQAYINNDLDAWKKVIDKMQRKKNKSNAFKMELLNYQYGFITHCFRIKDKKTAEHYVKLGSKIISDFEDAGYNPSLTSAYKAAFYGFKVGLNYLKAPFLGPKSLKSSKLAIKQDKNNPYGYAQYANTKYYMPESMGGSKEEAMKNYLKAEKLMASKPKEAINDWNYLSLLAMIGRGYAGMNKYELAKQYYEKVLEIEPNCYPVKKKLYPELLKAMK